MLKAKQIDKILTANIRINGVSANGASTNVTTPITSALSTAGNGGVSVPLQVSANVNGIGVITGGDRCEMYNSTTKQRISSAAGDEVYGKLTEAAGVYTLTYYTLTDAGTETAYSFSSATNIDFKFNYRFDFVRYPTDAITSMSVQVIDPITGNPVTAKWFTEKLAVTAINTISNLAKTPTSGTNIFLIVNEAHHNAFGGSSADFTISGKAIAWSSTNAGYSIDTTDDVIAFYETAE
ncbi:MAG: hypothetical protein KME46_25690 [Brasilonema angustatum HA4187-MV1]|nr:hypothetical protein [Brasilonema angustatum HA4187-MV1]